MTLVSRVYYGCAASRNKGTCDNRSTIRLDRLEETILKGIQENLVTPELTQVFIKEYTKEINRLRSEATTDAEHSRKRITKVEQQIGNIVEAVANGRSSNTLLDKLDALEAEKIQLFKDRSTPEPTPVRLHPNLADLYTRKVDNLRECLCDEGTRPEAIGIVRSLVEEIRLHPIDGELHIELKGDLATLLGFASSKEKRPGSNNDPSRTEWLVAGTCNRR